MWSDNKDHALQEHYTTSTTIQTSHFLSSSL